MKRESAPIFAGKIADTFALCGRAGVVVTPEQAWSISMRVGCSLLLLKPDESHLQVQIGGIEMTDPPLFNEKWGILLRAQNLGKADVPIGSTLWLE